MKKALLIIVALLCIGQLSFAANAIGDEIGDVLYTDIVTKINGVNINSFNINGSTAIYVTELRKLGYDVNWDGDNRQVTVLENPDKDIITSETEGVEGYVPENKDLSVGTQIGKVLYTDIKTTLGDTPVDSFNINGSTAIYVKSIDALGIDYQWDPELRQVMITKLPKKVLREQEDYEMVDIKYLGDDTYKIDYNTLPGYIQNETYGYSQSTSNAFKANLTDSEIIEKVYEYDYGYLKSRPFDFSEKSETFYDQDYGEITYFRFFDKKGDVLAVLPIEYGLPQEDFQAFIIETKDYDYGSIIADKVSYIEDNLEKSIELSDQDIDILKLPEKLSKSYGNITKDKYVAHLTETMLEKYPDVYFFTRYSGFTYGHNTTRGRLIDFWDADYNKDGINKLFSKHRDTGFDFMFKDSNDYAMLYFYSYEKDQLLYYRLSSEKLKSLSQKDEYISLEITYDQESLIRDGKVFKPEIINEDTYFEFDTYEFRELSRDNNKITVGPFKKGAIFEADDFVNGEYILSIESKAY